MVAAQPSRLAEAEATTLQTNGNGGVVNWRVVNWRAEGTDEDRVGTPHLQGGGLRRLSGRRLRTESVRWATLSSRASSLTCNLSRLNW